jgi:hypothetical protein
MYSGKFLLTQIIFYWTVCLKWKTNLFN